MKMCLLFFLGAIIGFALAYALIVIGLYELKRGTLYEEADGTVHLVVDDFNKLFSQRTVLFKISKDNYSDAK